MLTEVIKKMKNQALMKVKYLRFYDYFVEIKTRIYQNIYALSEYDLNKVFNNIYLNLRL